MQRVARLSKDPACRVALLEAGRSGLGWLDDECRCHEARCWGLFVNQLHDLCVRQSGRLSLVGQGHPVVPPRARGSRRAAISRSAMGGRYGGAPGSGHRPIRAPVQCGLGRAQLTSNIHVGIVAVVVYYSPAGHDNANRKLVAMVPWLIGTWSILN